MESSDNKNPDYYILKGDLKILTVSLGEAANEYQRAIYYNKNCIQAYIRLGKLYSKAKNFTEASNAFNNAIRLDSNQIAVYKYTGELNYTFGRYTEAKKYYELYLSRSEYSMDDQEKYAYILFFTGDYEKAGAIVDHLLLSNPDLPVLYRLKAYMSYELGNYQKGLESILALFKIQSQDKIIVSDYIYKGRLLITNGQNSRGVRDLITAYRMDMTKTELILEIAQEFTRLKNHQEAIEWYQISMNEGKENEKNAFYQIGKEY
jgi:tetratricopeptide (TPR) repeat protein